jgi:tryptophan 7-halogenase
MVEDNSLKKIAIVGGGTAGWVAASCIVRVLEQTDCEITLIESPEIGIIGVGEATIPSLVDFIYFLGIPEKEFIQETRSTFKLGIKFSNWRHIGHEYWHQFGVVGTDIDHKPFYQHWLKNKFHGDESEFTDFSPSVAMAKKGKFYIQPKDTRSNISGSEYAWHFDAGLVAKFLAGHAQKRGVRRIESTVSNVSLNESGAIQNLTLQDGSLVDADFFIDCTGQRGLLIGDALNVGYQDWSNYLPVNRALAIPTENEGPLNPYTHSIAHEHGWQWRIPLQHRTGNGYVYCNDFCSDEEAQQLLLNNIRGKPLAAPRVLKFQTGKRNKFWHKNCLSLGLSSGFLEPLESTGIYLSMKGALNFIQMLPNRDCDEATSNEYNRLMDIEYDCIRDFIVLHYCASQREDSDFWNMCQNLAIPESLQMKLALFKSQGRLMKNELDLFSQGSWYAVLEGMGIRPADYDRTIDASNFEKVKSITNKWLVSLDETVKKLPSHDAYVEQVCDLA